MKKCFWKPLALVHKLEHSLTATTFYKKNLFRFIPVSFRCHSSVIPLSFRFIPVHSCPFLSIPLHSGSFHSVSVFSNTRSGRGVLVPNYSSFFTRIPHLTLFSSLYRIPCFLPVKMYLKSLISTKANKCKMQISPGSDQDINHFPMNSRKVFWSNPSSREYPSSLSKLCLCSASSHLA